MNLLQRSLMRLQGGKKTDHRCFKLASSKRGVIFDSLEERRLLSAPAAAVRQGPPGPPALVHDNQGHSQIAPPGDPQNNPGNSASSPPASDPRVAAPSNPGNGPAAAAQANPGNGPAAPGEGTGRPRWRIEPGQRATAVAQGGAKGDEGEGNGPAARRRRIRATARPRGRRILATARLRRRCRTRAMARPRWRKAARTATRGKATAHPQWRRRILATARPRWRIEPGQRAVRVARRRERRRGGRQRLIRDGAGESWQRRRPRWRCPTRPPRGGARRRERR